MLPEVLKDQVLTVLEDMKAQDITIIDVHEKASFTDFIVIACGASDRHTKAVAQRLIEDIKKLGTQPLGVEGMDVPSWILVDLGDVVTHIMQAETRSFYDIEQLWQTRLTQNDDEDEDEDEAG